MHIVNASLSADGKVTPLAGLSFNPVAEVRVMAPQNTGADGFTATLRGTANGVLTVELNGKPYMTVSTNSAGSATVKVDIPLGTLNGDALTLRAYDKNGSDETKVYYYKKDATQLVSLSAQYYMGTVSFVKNGHRVGSPHYSITSTDLGDWWTITAVLSGISDELVTDDVDAQIMLSNGDFRTVHMTLTDSTEQNGETLYTFKGLYYQNGYRDKPLPTNISMQYYDRMQTVFIADTENRLDYDAYRGNSKFYDALDTLDAQTEEQLSAITNQGKAD